MSNLVQRIKEAQLAFQKEAQSELANAFKAFFALYPQVERITWTQYTPYFNDGETCEFSVNELEFHGPEDGPDPFAHHRETEPQYLGYTPGKGCQYSPAKRAKTDAEQAFEDAADQLSNLVEGLGDFMKDIFGDHVEVTATKGGFSTDSYDHE